MKRALLKQTAHLPFSRRSFSVLIITLMLISANPVGLNLAVGQASLANTKIAFTSRRDGNWEIYTMNPDGTDLINLTNHPVADFHPSWSPDGTKIAFGSNRDGNWEIYTMNPDGTDLINLTNHPADDYHSSWAPDGTKIAFGSNRDGNEEIYTMNIDGTDTVRLTNHPSVDIFPAWSPVESLTAVGAKGKLITTWGAVKLNR